MSLPIHPSLRRAYEALEPLFLEHIITEDVGGLASFGLGPGLASGLFSCRTYIAFASF